MQRPDRPRNYRHYDWEREQVFAGYDPERDGFAYPLPERIAHAHCTCTVIPTGPRGNEPEVAICDFCLIRLLMEA